MESFSSRVVKLLLRAMRLRKPFETYDLDIRRVRKHNLSEPEPGMYKGCTLEKTEHEGFAFWRLTPVKSSGRKVLIYFHGGGYVEGMVKEQWSTISKISRQSGATVLIPDYPLAPEHAYQETFEMLELFYLDRLKQISSENVVFIGDSAGGGLLISFAMYCRDKGIALPVKLIALSPWMDISMTNPSIGEIEKKDPMLAIPGLKRAGEMYAAGSDLRNYQLSPLYGDVNGLPEIHLFAGTHDILYPDEALFAEQARKLGFEIKFYEYPAMVHCWMFLPIKEAKKALDEIISIL